MKQLLMFLLAAPLVAASIFIDAGSSSDHFFTGGKDDFTITASGATGDLSLRYGAFGYHIPAQPGAYLVTLHLRETGTVSAKNQRIFSVKLNGQTVIDRLDLFAANGLAPTYRSFVTAVSGGFIDLDFTYALKSAIVSAIQIDVIGEVSTAYPEGFAFSRVVDEPAAAGTGCQPGDYAAGAGPPSPVMGAPLFVCIAGALRRFRSDPEPWGNAAVSDLGGVLQVQTPDPDKPNFPPAYYFRTTSGDMIGPFTFQGAGPIPGALKFPVLIQPLPRTH